MAVVVVAGVGMVTSLTPAAPAMPQLMLPCSIAESSHGVSNCLTSRATSQPRAPFLSLPLQAERSQPQAELWEEQEE